jgi:hypothetical protein
VLVCGWLTAVGMHTVGYGDTCWVWAELWILPAFVTLFTNEPRGGP